MCLTQRTYRSFKMTTIQQLQKALESINDAIEELYFTDGMQEYAERLNFIVVEIEGELEELESLEGKDAE